MQCPTCSTPIPSGAKFCPKCGKPATAGPAPLPRAAGALPSTGPIPRAGKLFIAALILGLTLVATALATHNRPLLCFGLGVLAAVAIVAIIGHHFS
jgi:hypothetical protein